MIKEDYMKFSTAMAVWGETCVGKEDEKRPTKEKVLFYFQLLEDLPLDEIKENGKNHFRRNRWFPAPCDLRNENGTLDAAAIDAYNIIEELMDGLYDPMIGIPCLNAMNERLESMGRAYLKPILMKWGSEI